jgi:hypothetical protein
MNLTQFKDWANGKSLGKYTDGEFVGQCVSLINQYLARTQGIYAGKWGHAYAWANDGNPIRTYYDKVSGTPQAGDLLVWGTNYGGGYGHIAISLGGGKMLEQNGAKALVTTISNQWANPTILRRKGAPAPQGGSNVATKVTIPLLRIIHSEMEGWPYHDTHAGKFDKAFWDSWGGQDLEAVIWEKWNKNGNWRNQREANRVFFEQNSALLEELKKNPTKAQYDEVYTKMKEEQAKAQKATDEAEAARLALAVEQANKSEDTKLLDDGRSWIAKLVARLWGKK